MLAHLFDIIWAAGAQIVVVPVPNILACASLQAGWHASGPGLLHNFLLLQSKP